MDTDYLEFAVEWVPAAEGGLETRVDSPAGHGSSPFEPPTARAGRQGREEAAEESAQDAPERDVRTDPGRVEGRDEVKSDGEDLYRALFRGGVAERFHESLGMYRARRSRGLRLQFCLDPSRAHEAAIGDLSWELICKPGADFLGLSRSTPVVRYLKVERPAELPPLQGPLRILVVLAQPEGGEQLDLAAERRRIEENWGRQVGVQVEVLERPSTAELCDTLLDRPAHVLHWMGHGHFDLATGEGALLFDDEQGQPDPVSGQRLARLLDIPRPPALVVLNACNSGRSAARAGLDPFAGVAAALVKGGLLAVVAMRRRISDAAAIVFSGALYRRLAAGDGVDAAVAEGRLAVDGLNGRSLEWSVPVLFLRTETGRVLETPRISREILELIRDFSSYVEDKARGFVGRRFVFDAIDQFAGRNPRGYFFLRGDPGIGKTALLAQMVKLYGHVHHFNIRTRNISETADFLKSVCARLIADYRLDFPSLPPEAGKDSGFLLTLLDRISKRLQPGQKVFVLVDALDEADRMPRGVNTLCLPDALPAGIYFVVTSRRDGDARLPIRVDCESHTLFLEHDSRDNLADVEEFLRGHLQQPGIRHYLQVRSLAEEAFVAEMAVKSEGNFMYLHYVLPEIARGSYAGRSLNEIPQGLENYYEDHWRRMQWQEEVWQNEELPVIMALTVIAEPVPLETIADFAGVPDPVRVLRVIKRWKPFLHEERIVADGVEEKRYRLYHLSFFDFLKKKDEVEVSFRVAHERIVKALTQH